jgi:nucleotide-binding universal stress UspA family protein
LLVGRRQPPSLLEAAMVIRDILVSVDASEAGEGRLRLALSLARGRRARLTALFILPMPRDIPPTIGLGPISPTAPAWPEVPAAAPHDPERAEALEALFRGELRSGGIEGEWYLLGEYDLADFVGYANAADLTILGQQPSEAPAEGAAGFAPDAVVVEVGRPVLVVPAFGSFTTVGRRALVAWDGSREAARALGDALPLVEGAEAVTVLYVGARESELEEARPALDRIVHHLQRHSLKARWEEAPRGDIAVADLLLSRAADLGADLIVAGAYHHSPLREALLGGVSRGLLRHMTVPVLMAH